VERRGTECSSTRAYDPDIETTRTIIAHANETRHDVLLTLQVVLLALSTAGALFTVVWTRKRRREEEEREWLRELQARLERVGERVSELAEVGQRAGRGVTEDTSRYPLVKEQLRAAISAIPFPMKHCTALLPLAPVDVMSAAPLAIHQVGTELARLGMQLEPYPPHDFNEWGLTPDDPRLELLEDRDD
jgi:C4-dicarboxylate-specific signal transduction histidine kinase